MNKLKPEIILDTRRESIPHLSIIVPVYNTSRWAEMTLSVLHTPLLENAELIVVDDGSTDDSPAYLPGWLSTFPGQVLLLRQPNLGLSAARNTGLSVARGRWLAFCDSDDWLNASTLSAAINKGEESRADAVFWRSVIYDDVHQSNTPFYDEQVFTLMLLAGGDTGINVQNEPLLLALEPNINTGLYRRSVWMERIGFFQHGKVYEDLAPHYRLLFKAANIQLLDRVGYYYRIGRPGKITEQRSLLRRDMVDAVAEVMTIVPAELSPRHCQILMAQLLRFLHWCGSASLPADRHSYYESSCHLFRQGIPRRQLLTALKQGMPVRQSAVALALLMGNTKSLCLLAAGYGWLSMVSLLPALILYPSLWQGLFRLWHLFKQGDR